MNCSFDCVFRELIFEIVKTFSSQALLNLIVRIRQAPASRAQLELSVFGLPLDFVLNDPLACGLDRSLLIRVDIRPLLLLRGHNYFLLPNFAFILGGW